MEKITLFNVYKFKLPLKKELIVKNNKLNKREGLLINIGMSDGISGFGEISPLPFFHSENVDDAKKQIKELKQNNFFIKKIEDLFKKPDLFDFLFDSKNTVTGNSEAEPHDTAFIKSFNDFLNKLNDLFCDIRVYPSVRTGFEMALISLLFIRPGLEKIFKSALCSDLPVCRLIMDLKKDLKKEIQEIINNGYKAIKIKVGRGSPEKEIRGIEKIKKLILENQLNTAKLRLDANGLWSLSEALYFGKAIGSRLIEYIEEPSGNISEYEQFFKETQIPVALDEKLPDLMDLNKINELNSKKCPDYLKAVIIKPDFIGGFFKTAGLIKFARSNGIKPVLSNSFNSSLLISFITLFAGIMHLNDIPLGIDSLSLFSENLLAEDIKIIKGEINILEVLNNIKKINFNLLSPAGF
ncbi:MAG: o-succinylbenzoate synthase [Candidatus Humimicrobiaceae bacterium]